MKYLSVCSGICAPTVAWKRVGWSPVGFAEIEKFPSAVLRHHYPNVPNLGDITAEDFIGRARDLDPEGLVGGTPCQAFSVAGLGNSLADERGQLTLRFVEILHGCDSIRWAVWENVPGVLSKPDNPFGCFLAAIIGASEPLVPSDGKRRWLRAGAAYGPKAAVAWRVLDAQYFGLAQRRKRVFVVVRVGATGFDPAKVLLECEGVRRDSPPSREAGAGATPILEAGARTGRSTADAACGIGVGEPGDPMFTLQATKQHAVCMAHGQANAEIVSDGSPSLTCNHEAPIIFDTSQVTSPHNRSNPRHGGPSHPLTAGFDPPAVCITGDHTHALTAEGHDASEDGTGRGTPFVAYRTSGNSGVMEQGDKTAALNCNTDQTQNIVHRGMTVRRLTPRECERLQGFPDDFTLVPHTHGKPAKDGPRYKALGNSMATTKLYWIGRRLAAYLETKGPHP